MLVNFEQTWAVGVCLTIDFHVLDRLSGVEHDILTASETRMV